MTDKAKKLELPERQPFFTELWSLVRELIFSILEFLISCFDDLSSFRNKLVILTYVMVLVFVYLRVDVVLASSLTGIWSTVLAYYLKKRQESDTLDKTIEFEEEKTEAEEDK